MVEGVEMYCGSRGVGASLDVGSEGESREIGSI